MRPTETGHATIEVLSWVTKFVGGDGSGRRVFTEPVAPGETVRQMLQRFSARHPELDRALWEPSRRDPGPHIEILVNDAVLGVSHALDSPLRPGDRLSLVGAFMGGSPAPLERSPPPPIPHGRIGHGALPSGGILDEPEAADLQGGGNVWDADPHEAP